MSDDKPLAAPAELPDLGLPIPPPELFVRIASGYSNAKEDTYAAGFIDSGRSSIRDLQRALAGIGAELTDFTRILDFGCGPGRMLRRLASIAEGREIWGVDVDGMIIDWDRENLPFAQFEVTEGNPPLSFADGHFDLVYNHSVLTHLPEDMQDRWLEELHRVTAPGGIVVLTTHGPAQLEITEDAMRGAGDDPALLRGELERQGISFIANDVNTGSTHQSWYRSTFHAPWYVFEHWTRWFNMRAYFPLGSSIQDLVILQRPAEGKEPTSPILARPQTAGAPAAADAPAGGDHGDALAAARDLLDRRGHLAPEADGARALARTAAERVTRRASWEQTQFDRELLRAVENLQEEVRALAATSASTAPPISPLLSAILDQQSERIERVWKRVGLGEGPPPPTEGNGVG
jgi:SAM-dependent methyltransferase